jgi:hypothetical protein
MRHKMMPCESECDGVVRFATQRTTKSIDIEAFRRLHIMRWKSQMKKHVLHGNFPRMVGWSGPLSPAGTHRGLRYDADYSLSLAFLGAPFKSVSDMKWL